MKHTIQPPNMFLETIKNMTFAVVNLQPFFVCVLKKGFKSKELTGFIPRFFGAHGFRIASSLDPTVQRRAELCCCGGFKRKGAYVATAADVWGEMSAHFRDGSVGILLKVVGCLSESFPFPKSYPQPFRGLQVVHCVHIP